MITSKGKISKEKIQEIVRLVKEGNYDYVACKAAGISQKTYERWRDRGEELLNTHGESSQVTDEHERLYAELVEEIEEAEALAEVDDVHIVNKAKKKNYQAAQWHLERKTPERWGKREVIEVNPKGAAFLVKLYEALNKPIEPVKTPLLSEGKEESQTTTGGDDSGLSEYPLMVGRPILFPKSPIGHIDK